MKKTDPKPVSTLDIQQLAVGNVVRLIRRLESGDDPSDDLPEVRQLLESLPMATGEFGLASNRLKNARRYSKHHSNTAARLIQKVQRSGLKVSILV